MKQFRKMIEVVNTEGGVASYCPLEERGGWTIDPVASEQFTIMAKKNQVFVFSPFDEGPIEYNFGAEYIIAGNVEGGMPEIDAPFPIFSIEMSEGSITKGHQTRYKGERITAFIDCILVYEQPANKNAKIFANFYWLMILSRFERENESPMYLVTSEIATDLERHLDLDYDQESECTVIQIEDRQYVPNVSQLRLVQKFLNRLNREASGQESVHFRAKVRSGGKKEFIKIRRIIHIAPKKTEKFYASKYKIEKPIEWSHKWFSRGHWRRLEPGHIGKDRSGDYVEFGRTWVTDSVKGPDHLPMIKKTYVVDEE